MLVTNHCRGIVRLLKGKIELRPGENTVADDDWNAVKGNQHVQQLRAMKKLTVTAGGEAEKPLPVNPPAVQTVTPKTQELTHAMSAKEAIAAIKESTDEDWLNASMDAQEETRTTVEDALELRLEELADQSEED